MFRSWLQLVYLLMASQPSQNSSIDHACTSDSETPALHVQRQQARDSADGQCALDLCIKAARSGRQALLAGAPQPDSAHQAQPPTNGSSEPAQPLLHSSCDGRQSADIPSEGTPGPSAAWPGAESAHKVNDATPCQPRPVGGAERRPQAGVSKRQPSGSTEVELQSVARMAAHKPKRRKTRRWTEGTALGNGGA